MENKYNFQQFTGFKIWGKSESGSGSVKSYSLQPYRLEPPSLLCPWDTPGKNIGVYSHFFLQGIFPSQGLNLGLPHCRQMLHCLSHHISMYKLQIVIELNYVSPAYLRLLIFLPAILIPACASSSPGWLYFSGLQNHCRWWLQPWN